MTLTVTNNALSIVQEALSNTATTFTVASGEGALFPTLGTQDYFYATLVSAVGNFEIVKITARADDSFTMERGQEGTIAIPFPAFSRIELRVTAANIASIVGDALSTPVANVVYVTKNGLNTNGGRSIRTPVLTIARGLEIANALGSGYVVSVYPGTYEEAGEMVIGPGNGVVSMGGQYLTNVVAPAGGEQVNMFLLSSASYVQGFTFRGMRLDSFENPTKGFAVAFAPGALIQRSPYVRDISQVSNFIPNTVEAALGPELSPPNPQVGYGGGVILADRAVLDSNSIFPYVLAFAATPRSPNGIGYCAKNGAGINGISSISIFQRCSFYALNGGQISLNNSGTQFGDISMRAKGFTQIVQPNSTSATLVPDEAFSITVMENMDAIIDTMWNELGTAGYLIGVPPSFEAYTRRDAENLIRSIANDIRDGDQKVTQAFALGFFDYKADLLIDSSYVPAVIYSFDVIKAEILELTLVPSNITMVSELINNVKVTVNTPVKINFGSLVESLSHQFNNAGSGVNQNALPLNFRKPGQNTAVPYTIVEEDGGRVRWSGADENNNQYFSGGTKINGLTGRFEGRPFNVAVRQIARRLANSRGAF